ncbi:MAG: GNAT family N-acetyltransferase [Acidobacteriota bacterium]
MSEAVVISKLKSEDAEAYRALMLDAYREAPEAFTATVQERLHQPLSWWRERFTGSSQALCCVFGAFKGGGLVGVAGLRQAPRPRTRHKATLFGLFVHPEATGRGLGRRLVDAVLAEARSRPEILAVQLTVTDTNKAALALYGACGFERFGVEPMAMRIEGRSLAKVHMWCSVGGEG